ncbi:site-specific recombinase resolvase [Propionivibrio sp.]|uniref:site-specific recombinase resolvase n=1 Tax=Propionivibrio sp. TaxID=2212460 RepID=UPI00260B7890|nr:site-specific recombinase resolvase [Propionivibrio sp.]
MTRIIQTGTATHQGGRPGAKLTTFIPVRIKRHGGRKVVIPAATGDKIPEHDAPILTALSRAFHWQRLIDEGIVSSGSDIARREGLHQTTVNELLRLTLLSPTLIRSILDGQQPKTLSLLWLKNHLPPSDWDEQHALFDGFDA